MTLQRCKRPHAPHVCTFSSANAPTIALGAKLRFFHTKSVVGSGHVCAFREEPVATLPIWWPFSQDEMPTRALQMLTSAGDRTALRSDPVSLKMFRKSTRSSAEGSKAPGSCRARIPSHRWSESITHLCALPWVSAAPAEYSINIAASIQSAFNQFGFSRELLWCQQRDEDVWSKLLSSLNLVSLPR